MSRFFIERPIFATVLAIILVIAGLVSASILPIAQYPEISPPTVTITASYPGASAETLAKTVAAPIEEQLSGVEDLLYFNSTAASNGTITITATFGVGTDIDKASFNVYDRVELATPRLPDAADVIVFGARDYSMRIWLKPDRMAQLGLTTTDIAIAVNAQNAQYAAGKIGADPAPAGQQLVYTVTARGRMLEPEEFGEIILRSGGPNGVLRLKDVARIELGAQSYDQANSVNGQPAIAIAVFLQSGANALDLADAVRARMEELKKGQFPQDVDYLIPYDTTRFVAAAIKAVIHTLIEAAILVLLVVFVFLQTWRAT